MVTLTSHQMARSILLSNGCTRVNGASRRIGVAGGGLSGLALGFELDRLGHDVKVFEARPTRVGGRTRSYHDAGPESWIEAGAEFIGEAHLMWRQYAALFGLPLVPIQDYSGPVSPVLQDQSAALITPEAAGALAAEMSKLQERISRDAMQVHETIPWLTPGAEALDALSIADVIEQCALSDRASRALAMQFEANQGVSADKISYLGFLVLVAAHGAERFWTDTETYRCTGGVQRLSTAFHDALGDRVQLDAEVVNVIPGERSAQLVTKNGAHSFDEVVICAPVSAWPQLGVNRILPHGRIPQMGNSVKLLLALRRDFPLRWGLSPLAIDGRGLLQLLWETTAGQSCDYKVLTCFSGGSAAQALCEMSGRDRMRLCLDELERMMPGISAAVLPEKTRFKAWPMIKFSNGGYSCPAPGDVTGLWPTLWEPHQNVRFSGEANSRIWGFMEGALMAGVRTAYAIHSASAGAPAAIGL